MATSQRPASPVLRPVLRVLPLFYAFSLICALPSIQLRASFFGGGLLRLLRRTRAPPAPPAALGSL